MSTRRVRTADEAAPGVRVSTLDERPSASGARGRRGRDPRRAAYDRKVGRIIAAVVVVAVALAAYLVVTYSSLFAIRQIVATPTQHIDAATISQLAAVPEGSTLFNVDEAGVADRICANPWVSSVDVTRRMPDELDIAVTERTEAAVVMLSNGLAAWRLSADGYWLEVVDLTDAAGDAASASSRAQATAASDGVVYVSSVSVTVAPEAGRQCTDEALLALLDYLQGFSPELVAKVAQADASSLAGLSLTLTGGVEVSVGPATDVAQKEQALNTLLSQNAGAITYVNVRNPAVPSWRGLETAASTDEEQASDESAEG